MVNFRDIMKWIPGGEGLIIQRTPTGYKFTTHAYLSRGFFDDPGEETSVEVESDCEGNVQSVVLLRYMSQSGYREYTLGDQDFEENLKECFAGNVRKSIMKDLTLEYQYDINRMEIGDIYRVDIHLGPTDYVNKIPCEVRYKFIKNELELKKEGKRFSDYWYY